MGQIRLQGIRKSFGALEVLKGIDLDIAEGEFVVFVGPSGCGKSTLLRQISGLDQPNAGRIHIDGRDVTDVGAADRGLAMVFQSYALYPHMTVRDNLAFGLQNNRMPKAEIASRIAEAARMLEIGHLMQRRPGQLSGGQRQRVAIGRAVVRDPTAFLLDEPLSNLDAELRVSMRAELAALHARLKATMIYVTHDQIEAMTLADRIVVLLDLAVAGFIGAPRMNLIDAAEAASLAPGGLPRGAAWVGVRPQNLRLDDAGAELKVDLVEALGTETVLHGQLASGTRLIVAQAGQVDAARGDTLRVAAEPGKLHFFDDAGRRGEP